MARRATAPLTRDLYGSSAQVEAAVSAVPLVWGQGLTAYLDHYEYTCTEQLVSKGLSALIAHRRGRSSASIRNAATSSRSTPRSATLRGRLNDQGGLGLWASSPMTAEFPTVYAAHFLIEARDRGQKIPQDVLASVNDWLMRFAVDAGEHARRRAAARVRGVSADAAGHQADGGARRTSSRN